jgi:hypothetical protein
LLIATVIATALGLGAFDDAATTQPPAQLQALIRSAGYEGNI